MADEIRIRAAVAGDEHVVASLVATVQQLHVAARPDVFKAGDTHAFEAWARQAIGSARARILLAEAGSVPIGYAVFMDEHRADNAFAFERRWREVEQLGVHPNHRRRGVARALLEHIVASARADGIPTVELNTWAFNEDARAAFERSGFVARNVRFERPTAVEPLRR